MVLNCGLGKWVGREAIACNLLSGAVCGSGRQASAMGVLKVVVGILKIMFGCMVMIEIKRMIEMSH